MPMNIENEPIIEDPLDGNFALQNLKVTRQLLIGASDFHRLKPEIITKVFPKSAAATVAPHDITIATVSMKRSDIPEWTLPEHRQDKFPFKWRREGNVVTTSPNQTANEDIRYRQDKWIDDRMEILEKVLEAGANIISFGEFDYPPLSEPERDEEYNIRVVTMINKYSHPVFLFGGSFHADEDIKSRNLAVHNVGAIFANDALTMGQHHEKMPLWHHKRSAATKAGERLAQSKSIDLRYYKTVFGTIGVLICSDAHDPSIALEIFRNSSGIALHRLDYILVPSHNPSKKLYRSCQTLSYMANTMLIYTDSKVDGDKPKDSEIFSGGVSLTKWRENFPPDEDQALIPAKIPVGHPAVQMWKVDSRFPTFSQVLRDNLMARGIKTVLDGMAEK